MNSLIAFFTKRPFFTFIVLLLIVLSGLWTSPFEWKPSWLPSNPIAIDAIPDLGENQQIIYTEWPGKSPKDVDDQLTYPLSSRLLGIPGVQSIRSTSVFGLSTIYLIFEEDVDYYWSRSRILEKLNSLPMGSLPQGVQPALGPDATALGQVFWYTIESQDNTGNLRSGWSLDSLRSVQDYFVKDALSAVQGVAEVASIGGFVREYHIQLLPDKLEMYQIGMQEVVQAVRNANRDAGARTLEMNKAEYLIRSIGAIRNPEDIGQAVVRVSDLEPILVKDVAIIQSSPAERRGILDKNGMEAVGGVVVARFDANPSEVISKVKERIIEIEGSMPSKVLYDGTEVQMKIVPFYDRSILIDETIATLEEALSLEMLITFIVILLLMRKLSVSISVSLTLPIAVLMVFGMMKFIGITANVVALSGIAIAIGTMVDLGIIMSERIEQEFEKIKNPNKLLFSEKANLVIRAAQNIAPSIITAVSTTIISFLPIFALEAAEGKLFHPLAYTKSFSLVAALLVSLCFTPLFSLLFKSLSTRFKLPFKINPKIRVGFEWGLIIAALVWLSILWNPLKPDSPLWLRIVTVNIPLLGLYFVFERFSSIYSRLLKHALRNKWIVFSSFSSFVFFALLIWLGFNKIASPLRAINAKVEEKSWWNAMNEQFPGIQKEFMPALDEGEFLLMPTSMPHAGIQQNHAVLKLLDQAVEAIPEVEYSVGKLGRVESALDPAPISMYENVIRYKAEYAKNERGEWVRQWRDHIKTPDDIWQEIAAATRIPGVTGAPKLQPIETRLVMLQSGMRAPMGIKLQGDNLAELESFGLQLEQVLKDVEGVKEAAVFAERTIGKPYLELDILRTRIARYGLSVSAVQDAIETAIGGRIIGYTLEERARYAIRIRYPRALRDSPADFKQILVKTPSGSQIPLSELVEIRYTKGPQMIRREDTFVTSYLLFDREDGYSSGTVVNHAQNAIEEALQSGRIQIPAGIHFRFAGNWEQQQRAEARLRLIVPLVLLIILAILYVQFQHLRYALVIFAGISLAFSGGFIMIYLINQSGLPFIGLSQVNLSVAIWVGFIALFGIATDDGVIMGSYIKEKLERAPKKHIDSIHRAVRIGAQRRIRPAIMTTLTTLLALLPVLSSTGRGSDIMIPMAIPAFGGMLMASFSWILTPVLYAWLEEQKHLKNTKKSQLPKKASAVAIILAVSFFSKDLGAQQLPDSLLMQLITEHPSFLESQYQIEQEQSGLDATGYWKEPSMQIGVGVLPIETRLGSQQFRIGIQQVIPKIGSLKLQKEQAYQNILKAEWIQIDRALSIESQLRTWLIDWHVFQQKNLFLDSLYLAQEHIHTLLEHKLEQASISLDQLIESDIQRKKLERELHFNQITLQNISNQLNRFSTVDESHILSFSAQIFSDSMGYETLIKTDVSKNSLINQLEIAQKKVSISAQEVDLQKKPALQVGLDFWAIQSRTDATPTNNGRNVFTPTVGIQLPLFRSKYASLSEEQRKQEQALMQKQKAQLLNLQLQLESLQAQWQQSLIKSSQIKDELMLLNSIRLLKNRELENDETELTDILQLQQRDWNLKVQLLEHLRQQRQIENAIAYIRSDRLEQIARLLALSPFSPLDEQ